MASYEVLSPSEATGIAAKLQAALDTLGISLNKLAYLAGVTQPMAYHAYKGRLKRRTPNVRRLELYIHIAINARNERDVASIDDEIKGYLCAGGDVSTLRAFLRSMSNTLRNSHKDVAA